MELSEAEQFLDASSFSLGYDQQAPLYSWIVRLASLLFGMSLVTITSVKYCLLFVFYLTFFFICRNFWDTKKSLLITGSLVLFPTYSYELHRDLTHTVLASAVAAITCLLYIRAKRDGRAVYYLLIGVSIGLGMLSKYNFAFFIAALFLSTLSCREGRRLLFDKKISLTILAAVSIITPHAIWLVREDFLSVDYALARSMAGKSLAGLPLNISSAVGLSYVEAFLFLVAVGIFFHKFLSRRENEGVGSLAPIRLLAPYGLLVPLAAASFLQAGNFSGRWLAPVLFTLPLMIFSYIDMDTGRGEFRLFRSFCILVAVSILAAKAFVGFLPDVAGKVERVHVPYETLVRELALKLKEKGIDNLDDLSVISNEDSRDRVVAANIMALTKIHKFVPLTRVIGDADIRRDIAGGGGIFAFEINRRMNAHAEELISAFPSALPDIVLQSPYLHSSKSRPYVMGIVIIPKANLTNRPNFNFSSTSIPST